MDSISKLLFLEHVNVNTGFNWTESLEKFYFSALGFADDPRAPGIQERNKAYGTDSVGLRWANIGLQQFHLPWAEPTQSIRGTIGLYYPNLEVLAPRLRRNQVPFRVIQLTDEVVFDIQCPLGNKFRLHEYAAEHLRLFGPGDLRYSLTDGSCVDTSESYTINIPGDKSLGLGIGYVDFSVPVGSAAAIGEFYRYYFDAEVTMEVIVGNDSSEDVNYIPRHKCRVKLGSYQFLMFSEEETLLIAPYDGHHICIYVSDLQTVYNRMASSAYPEQLWINPRFLRTASRTVEEALVQREFRFKDIINLQTTEVVYELEHEVRSVDHPACCIKAAN